jgi:hypothetical protein
VRLIIDQCDRDQVGHARRRLGGKEPAEPYAGVLHLSTSWSPQRGPARIRNDERARAGTLISPARPRLSPAAALRVHAERRSGHSPDHPRLPPKRGCEHFWLAFGHDGAGTLVFELPGGGANVSGRGIGLSTRADQVLYQARRVKIVIPTTLTRICTQIALLVS